MNRRPALSLTLLLTLPLAACDSDSPTAPELPDGPVTWETLYAADISGLTDSTRQVVRIDSTFESVWEDVAGSTMPPPELPTVDFQRDMVLVVALGEQPESCYAIEVTDAFGDGTDLTVTVTESRPTAACNCLQVVVQPVEVVKVPRADQVDFRTVTAPSCPG
jgi:hypothetical protein